MLLLNTIQNNYAKQTPFAYLIILILFLGSTTLNAQVIYVDSKNGNDQRKGSPSEPVASIDQAVSLVNKFPHDQDYTIKVAPGFYVLKQQVKIESMTIPQNNRFTIEALIMPDDTSWKPSSMPVIHSISANNLKTYFEHCAGFEILRDKVYIRGLKFTGNSNPGVENYYPIERDSANLKTLEISQCLFVGEPNSAPIQGAVYIVLAP